MHGAGATGAIEVEHMSKWFGIGEAVKELRLRNRVQRAGWNGKDMYLELQLPEGGSKMTLPYVYMKTAQGDFVPWLCSQTDLLATDWQVC